jgi:hypothetical protein
MVSEVGKEENGDRADSTTGLNKRELKRKREQIGLEKARRSYMVAEVGQQENATEPTPPLA